MRRCEAIVAAVKTLPALMLAAAGVGFGHAVMPDHWMPLAVLSRTRRYSTRRTVRLSLAAGVTHVLVSLVLGAVLVVVGLQFRDTVSRHTDVVIGGILLVTGLAILAMEMIGRGHAHGHDHGHGHDGHSHDGHHSHDHGDDHEHDNHRHDDPHDHDASHDSDRNPSPNHPRTLATVIPFAAAASPDLTILPVFLAAGAVGVTASISSLIVFAAVTVATIVGLTTATAAGAKLLIAPWIDRGANLLTAGTLLGIGVLVAGGII